MVGGVEFLGGEGRGGHLVPDVGNVGDDYGEKHCYPGHYREGELRRGGVSEEQRAFGVCHRGEEGGVVVTVDAEQAGDDGDNSGGAPPEGLTAEFHIEGAAQHGVEHRQYADQEYGTYPPEVQQVEEVLILDCNDCAVGVMSVARGGEQRGEEAEEQQHEDAAIDEHATLHLLEESLLGAGADAHGEEHRRHGTRQEEDGEAQQQVAERENLLPAVLRIPDRHHRRAGVEQAAALNLEVGAEELHPDGAAQQHTAYKAVDVEASVVGRSAEDVRGFRAEFIADSLQDEAEKYQHPEPIGAAEARGVIEGKGGEEGAAEHHQGGEGQFPFAPQGVDVERLALRGFRCPYHCLAPLHKEQAHQQAAKQRDDQPPVYL